MQNKRKLRLREPVQNFLGIALFYLIIILGVILLNARFEQLNNQQKNADVQYTQSANTNR